MEIILIQDVEGLGYQYDTVKVKDGYGRNYLIPKKLAVVANRTNKGIIAERVRQTRAKEDKMVHKIEDMVERIKQNPIKVGAKVGTTEKIFGSVTNVQLADAIKQQTGIEIDRRKLTILEDVKTLGSYQASLYFREDLKYTIDFEVVAE
ncbi:MAG TPA: 50S ribosomal protein L9 [Chitinophagales bacterium]|nr:50S ribosomal protein L9 [Chitinophagales bacterium]HRK26709.1 50S ribosomal protein L9 [Chitinophagales bacterium]